MTCTRHLILRRDYSNVMIDGKFLCEREYTAAVNSVVIDKNRFLEVYKMSEESGDIDLFKNVFKSQSASSEVENSFTYIPQLRDKVYFSNVVDSAMYIFTRDRLDDTWSDPIQADGLEDFGYDQISPFVLNDGTTMYFAAKGEQSLGGYDIFLTRYSTDNGKFLRPENIGMPFNSPDNDYMYAIDEANNIQWAARLTNAGVKVLFGLPTLKIHSKLCLITRKENGQTVRYAHIGTGNFNEKTAKIYTDFALFTVNPQITAEVENVFEFIEYPYTRPHFSNLLVSPINARKRIYAMIDREIENALTGLPSYINFKVNNLVDLGIIDRLYKASQSGVKIRAVVRGMCSLRPGIEGLSDNIYITSIVDRFLEHPRVMIFCNNNNPELYISSADWMTRNLDYRIEVGAPVLDADLRDRINTIFRIQCNDNQKARILDKDQKNEYVKAGENAVPVRSQIAIHTYLQQLESKLYTEKNKNKTASSDKKNSK